MDPINDEPPQIIKSFCSSSAAPPHGEDSIDSMIVKGEIDNDSHHMSVICANDLVGCTFLMDPREDGQHHHAHIMEFIQDHEHDLKLSDDHHKFRISINDDEYEEIIMYNKLMDLSKRTRRMMTLTGDSNILSDIKVNSFAQILTTKGHSTMC
jgi:hypothetical protein